MTGFAYRMARLGLAARRALVSLSRQAFEVYLLVLAALAGIQGLTAPQDASLEPLLPGWVRVTWFGGLLIGSVITLGGLMLPPPHSQRAEGAGLFVLIGPALAYVVMMCAAEAYGQATVVATFAVVLATRLVYARWEAKAVENAIRVLDFPVDGRP